jgi:hypothetical protein
LAPIAHEAIAGIERLVDDVIAATDPRAWRADASPAIPGVSSRLSTPVSTRFRRLPTMSWQRSSRRV